MNTTGRRTDPLADPVEVVRELASRYQSGDHAGAAELFHPDIRIEQPTSLPHGGTHRGRDAMGKMGGVFGRYWERTIAGHRVFGAGDDVVQVTTQTWTAKSTGRSATVDVVELFTVTDGLITEIRVFQGDTHLLLGTLADARSDAPGEG